MRISPRIDDITLSPTLALDARVKELVAGGRDIVNMAVGEPDFPAPAACRRGAIEKVESLDVRYTPAAGSPTLRAAIAKHLSETRGVPFTPDQITVCHSAKHALSGALLALVREGDEVLLPVPSWVSYFELIRLAGGLPMSVPGRQDCGPDLDRLASAVTPRTVGILINSPNNPSGYVWTEREMEQLCQLASEHDLWILSDEIYRRLVYEGEPNPSPVTCGEAARGRTVIVDGASKSLAMTGYRVGYLAGPPELASAVARLHSQMTGSPNAVSQEAYRAGLEREPGEVERMFAEFDRRRLHLLGRLADLGLATPHPRGAFYAFPDVTPYLDERGAAGFCEDLLESQGLAVVPGSAFGVEGHIRISYALSLENIDRAMDRLAAFLGTVRG